MRLIIFALGIAALATAARADFAQDRATTDSVVAASYQAISGPAGAKRDFARLEAISTPDARFVMVTRQPASGTQIRAMNLQEFEKAYAEVVGDSAFYETGTHNQTEGFGDVATVLSTYESRDAPDATPFNRGLNSYQLVRGTDGWRIQTIFWEDEAPEAPLPPKYLPAP
jgi:hypothetical protein